MTRLRLHETDDRDRDPDHSEPLARKGWIPSVASLGVGSGLGAGVIVGVAELLRGDPHDALKLLKDWGPRFLLGFIGMVFVWDLSRRMIRLISRLVEYFGDGSRGITAMAVSMSEIAAKGDSNHEETRTAVTWNSRQLENLRNDVRELIDHLKADKEGVAK